MTMSSSHRHTYPERVNALGLSTARRQLIDAQLIAYRKPLYQVLGLVEASTASSTPVSQGSLRSIGDILREALGGAA